MKTYSLGWRLVTVFLGTLVFGALLSLAYPKQPIAEAKGGVRAVGAQPSDYRFVYEPVEIPPVSVEAAAVAAVIDAAERDEFKFRSVTCQRRMGADYCAVCFDHPRKLLGAALVRCAGLDCKWPLETADQERIGWNPEFACARP